MNAKTEFDPCFLSRRIWLRRSLQLCVTGALWAVVAGCHKETALVCADPARLTDQEINLRDSLHYIEQSPDGDRVCGGCAFFERAASAACGTCKLLKGPVNPKGHCDSWNKRSA